MDEAENCDRIAIIDQGKIVALGTPDELKAVVGKDRVQIRTADDASAIASLKQKFNLDASVHEGLITVSVTGGEGFVPKLFAELGVPILSVAVARPSLDDVFMHYTGSTIRESEATSADKNRANPMVRMRSR
jgi:ABC-2 type transport system ATP-binding protein